MTKLRKSTESLSPYYNALSYPGTGSEDFYRHRVANIQTGRLAAVSDLMLRSRVTTQTLPGTDIQIPAYDIVIDANRTMTERIAVIGYGANCNPRTVIQKLRDRKVSGEFLVAQATLERHSVVYGAFIGTAGTIPATVVPDPTARASVTVNLLTLEQAHALSASEQNYDLVFSQSSLPLRHTSGLTRLSQGALLYVSIWGAGAYDGGKPAAVSAIPQATDFHKMNSGDIVQTVAARLGHAQDAETFFDTLPGLPLARRLELIEQLQHEAFAASVKGVQVKPAGIRRPAMEIGRSLPYIHYTRT